MDNDIQHLVLLSICEKCLFNSFAFFKNYEVVKVLKVYIIGNTNPLLPLLQFSPIQLNSFFKKIIYVCMYVCMYFSVFGYVLAV